MMILHGSYPPDSDDSVDDTRAGMWKLPHVSY